MGTYRFVLPFAKPYGLTYLAGLLLVPLSAAASLGIPKVTGLCVDALGSPGGGADRLFHNAAYRTLDIGSWSLPWLPSLGLVPDLLGLALVSGLTLFGIRWLIIGASRRIEFDLRNYLFRHLQGLDQLYYNNARTGDIMSRITADVERVRLLVGPIILYASRTALLLAFGLPMMLGVSVNLTLMVMVPLSLMTIAVRLIGPRVHREVFRAQEILSDLSSLGQEDFSGIRVVKSFAQEDGERARFSDVAERYLRQNMRAIRASAWMQPLVGGIGDLALISLLLIGGSAILDGTLDFGEFVTFAGYQVVLIWPMLSIGWVVNQFQRARAGVDRLRELLVAEAEVTEPSSPARVPKDGLDGSVKIRGLNFFHGDQQILHDINLEVPAGGTIAIIGKTGSGKSTLVQLIPRVLPAPQDAIFLSEIDINSLPLEAIRKSIGYVPQESFLFSRTVGENIAFGVDGVDSRAIYAVSRIARLDKDIDQFPRGYDEMVGERGVTLSGGQKQRVALARALLPEPRLLILDDAFSAVDTHTEEEILSNLRDATQNLTTIVVSHRVSSIAHADCIYVMDEGRIAESGSHRDLLARDGIYAEIHRLQQLSDELESM